MSFADYILNFLFNKRIPVGYTIVISLILILHSAIMMAWGIDRGKELQAQEFAKCGGKIVYGFRYTKSAGDCTFITNSTDEGCYYKTELEAWENGKSSMDSDSLIGYKVYKKSLDVFMTIETSN